MSAYNPDNPNHQIAWDSTSLSALQECPRSYQYKILEGWGGSSVDLEFGLFAASAFERFQKARLDGLSREAACSGALRWLIEESWDGEDEIWSAPWGGAYLDQWRCTGEKDGSPVPYKNQKGNRAKCPYSHSGLWFDPPAPDCCGCGGSVEVVRQWSPDHKSKNRVTLVRMFIWYCLDQPERIGDGLAPYCFPDGTKAVELSFKIPLDLMWVDAPLDEHNHFIHWKEHPYLLCGHIDYLGTFGSEMFVVDNKTTTKPLTGHFFNGYMPNTQFDTYDLAASILFPDLNISGVLIDAAAVTPEGANFARHPYYKTDDQRQEHLDNIEYWIKQAESFAENNYWPMNKSACWRCQFSPVCSRPPKYRADLLRGQFNQRPRWDPTIERK